MRSRKRFLVIFSAACLAFLPGVPALTAGAGGRAGSPLSGLTARAGATPAPVALLNTLRFERISVEQGLSQSAVLTILQDQRGFMWFGTEDGLNRYDGYEFVVYKHDAEDPTTLADNFVSVVYEDRSGELWIGTRSGLDRFDRSSGTFVHYRHDPDDPQSLGGPWVVAIYEDSAGTFWVGTEDGGLDQFDRETQVFTHHRHDPGDPGTISDNTVRVIYEDSDGELWIGTHGGLNRFDPATGSFVHYTNDPRDPQSLSDNDVSAVFEDGEGALWVGTEGGGLNQLDRSSQTIVRYQQDPDDAHSLSHDRVRAILEDRTGRLWVGTQDGLNLLDRQREGFVHFRNDLYDAHSLSSSSVWSISEDRTGVLWFGTYGGGLSKYNGATDRFTLYQHNPSRPESLSDDMVWSICEDGEGNLWIGTFNGGLNRLDRRRGTVTVYRNDPADPASLSSDDVRAILEDHTGTLWVGTAGGLDRFEPASETFAHYRHAPGDPTSLSQDRVTTLLEDRSGNLWVGTRTAGLNRFDRVAESFVRYQEDPDDPSSLSDNRVWALYEDKAGVLWVGTLGGINVWDPVTDRFTRYVHDPDDPRSLSNDAIFSFYSDPSGTMWVGTWGGGLDRFDRATQSFGHYTEKDGLANNAIYGIQADSEGSLWISTNGGISRFDPRSETFRNYDASDGLQNNEFNVGAHFKSSSGEMFFGGIRGFNAFHPEEITDNPHVPPVVITALGKSNATVRRDLSAGAHVQLSYRDSSVSFEFAALDYTAPEKNRYAYRLEGQDQDWVYAGTRRYASYTNLGGGQYVFRVRGSNNDGLWNEEGIAVTVGVTPPFWETWWFRGIGLVVLMGAATGGYWLRVRSIEGRRRELEREVRERTRVIERRTQELEALYRADEQLHRHLRLDDVLTALVDVAVDISSADKSSLMMWDDRRERLVVRASYGFSPDTVARMSFGPGEGAVGLVASTGEPIVVEDTRTERVPIRRDITDAERIGSFIHVPVRIGDEIFGVFNVSFSAPRAFADDERRLVQALAQRAALAIENAQLYERAQQLAVVQERQRLARDLHDAVTQTLFSASLIAEVLPTLWESDPEEGRRLLRELRQLSRGALAEMRTLLLELRPAALMETSLGDLLRQLAEAASGRTGLPIAVTVEGQAMLPRDVHVATYRIAQEALNNVVKHANASRAEVNLRWLATGEDGEGRGVELSIRDDGCGFDVDSVPAEHLGLGIMRERAQAIGAKLEIESGPGQGTRIAMVWRGDE